MRHCRLAGREVTSLNEHSALRGSPRWLQLVVNRRTDIVDKAIAKGIGLEHGDAIQWLSPLESDGFTEYTAWP